MSNNILHLPNKMNPATAFKVFMNNLYYELSCNDLAFQDIMTNRNSPVQFYRGEHLVDRYRISQFMTQLAKTLPIQDISKLYTEFITKNKIKQKAV